MVACSPLTLVTWNGTELQLVLLRVLLREHRKASAGHVKVPVMPANILEDELVSRQKERW